VVEWRVNQCSGDRDGPENVGLFTIQPPEAAGSPRLFYWICELYVMNVTGR